MKIMIILWHWKELKNAETNPEAPRWDEISILNEDGCKIIRIDDALMSDSPESIKSLIVQQIKRFGPTDKVMVFLHDTSIHKEYIQSLEHETKAIEKTERPALKFVEFGGGKVFIYFNPARNSGLLGYSNFPTGKVLYRWKDRETEDNHREKCSIVEFDGNSYKVKSEYFQNVWAYYSHRPKERLFELKENLYIHLLGNKNLKLEEGLTLLDILKKNNHWLEKEIRNLIDRSIWQDKIREFYQSEAPSITTSYRALADFIEVTPFESDYLKRMRAKFDDLLQEMSEKIYV